MDEPVILDATARPIPPYQAPRRISEVGRTPRTYAATQSGRDSYLTRPAQVHDTSSDAKSWSRQTQDALDAYRKMEEKQPGELSQTIPEGNARGPHGLEQKVRFEVAEYRLDTGNGGEAPGKPRVDEWNRRSKKSASRYFATYIDTADPGSCAEKEMGGGQSPPKNHRMTKMIVKEDIEFFTALLEGHDPPGTTKETEDFVHEETETHRHSQEMRELEADRRRHEEAEAAKADTDFLMMLMMQKE